MRNFKSNHARGFAGRNRRSFASHRPRRFGNSRGYRAKSKPLNPLTYINRAAAADMSPYQPSHSFTDFSLAETVISNIRARGFSQPTAVQDQAILPILAGRDLVGVANTGTGKTAAFLLPLITQVVTDRHQKVLIITPTRELAVQIRDELKLFSAGLKIYSALCIGGASVRYQSRELSRRPNFVVGTPGRIKDLAARRLLHLSQYRRVVLDEVDRMLDMGFIHDIQHIISLLPQPRQSLFFSATIPDRTKLVMQSFLTDPVTVSVATGPTAHNVAQDIVRTRGKNKLDILYQLLVTEEFKKVLVFGRTKWGVNKLEVNLTKRGLKAVAIHGNKSQNQRSRAIRLLKSDQVRILLATDVASRGIDIENITHVINYDAPASYDDYIHRIGRTGRAGKKGVALTFVD